MNNTAIDIDSVIEFESTFEHQLDGEIVEVDFRDRDSLSENFNAEIEAWARHSLASNGFGDF